MEKITSQLDLHKNIQRFSTNLKKSGKQRITKAYLDTRLECLESYWNRFREQHDEIVITAEISKKETYFTENIYEKVEELYFESKTFIKEHLEEIVPSNPIVQSCNSETNVKTILPPINLPKFSGSYQDWATFRDLFVSVVASNEKLSAIQKYHYLKTSLIGEAEQLLRNLPLTAANYEEAWNIVQKRYDNKRCIVNAILNKFLHQKRLTMESAKGIRDILDTSTECILSLKNIGINTSTWDVIVIHIMVSKLDSETHKQWELSQCTLDNELPTWSELSKFLESRFRTLEIINSPRTFRETVSKNIVIKNFAAAIETKCTYCSGQHFICHCKEFSKLNIEERRNFVQHNNICFNCLIKGHSVGNCRQRTSCKICHRRHHSLLHNTTTSITSQALSSNKFPETATPDNTNLVSMKAQVSTTNVLLATTLVNVQLPTGDTVVLRALLDQGSQGSFLSESACQLFGFKKFPINGTVTGIGSANSIMTKSYVNLQLSSLIDKTTSINVKAYILKKIALILPSQQINTEDWLDISRNMLADPNFHKPGPIDLLLGAEVYAQILKEGVIHNTTKSLIAQSTTLGWIISGQVTDNKGPHTVILNHTKVEVDELYKQLWEIQSDSSKRIITPENLKCERFYEETVKRAHDGRYIVKLPFKDYDLSKIANSRPLALKRLQQMEKRFHDQPEFHKNYLIFMNEYLTCGHMQEVKPNSTNSQSAYYLPHHAVIRTSSLSTKLRVVFDGSAVTPNGASLNEMLHIGPALQQDIRNLVTRWRIYPIVLMADIKQMYRQILISEEDTDYQRILWRNSPSEEVKEYKLLTVTYGTSCAPYLAIKTIQQLAKDEADHYSDVVEILKSDFYMDDLLTGFFSEEQAINAQSRVTSLLKQGGFELHKWASNSLTVLNNIPKCDQENSKTHIIPIDDTFKALGITWSAASDKFELKVNLPPIQDTITKRTVLSDVAKIFDPLGWLAPTVIKAKIFLQRLWQTGIDWDSPLTTELLNEWLQYRRELVEIGTIYLDRWFKIANMKTKIEIHGFSDASNDAYAAVVYLRIIDDTGISVSLIASKTKVAPIKRITTPRLELCGAVLLSQLIHMVSSCLNVNNDDIYAWTDSMIVLAWLNKGPTPWKTFVANRVSEILEVLKSSQWKYVSTLENPADPPSRGILPSELNSCSIWWQGPSFLRENLSFETVQILDTNDECKVITNICSLENNFVETLFCKFSSLSKLIRVVAYCIRFINICKHKIRKEIDISLPYKLYLSTTELMYSKKLCIQLSQDVHFAQDVMTLRSGKALRKGSSLRTLNAFIDSNNILRVGGRLENANIPYSVKHPIILAKCSRLSYLIVLDAHHRLLHGGPQIMLGFLRRSYWIISVKSLIKNIYHTCVPCFRHSAKPINQIMGNLPIQRVALSKPFYNCGVDYAGPVNLKLYKGRCNKITKGYIALFVCTSTKAVHLELVSDLTTEAFVAAFRRFVARRGQCKELWSDCGTTFVGASKELQHMLKTCQADYFEDIAAELSSQGTNWHFIPPGTPHFGGLWESGVKSVKYHLKRVLGTSNLTFEEYSTLLAEVEACLNSRPLTSLATTPDGSAPLTPGHFLIGEPIVVVPDEDLRDAKVPYLYRWKLVQKQVQDFWKRWSSEYLVLLQHRYKWDTKQPNIEIGSIVLLKDENLPPAKWLLGRVLEKYPGRDGHTRVVTVRCNDKVYKRPITKLCPLPV